MNLFKEVADIKTADQLHLPTPEVMRITPKSPPNPHEIQQDYGESPFGTSVQGTQQVRSSPDVDNMLKITSDGRKLGLDQRIINPNAPR